MKLFSLPSLPCSLSLESPMESMAASASIALSPYCRFEFSKRRRFHAKRRFLLSKKREDEADFHCDPSSNTIVPFHNNRASASLSKDEVMGLVLSAAAGLGWTTGSGMEGPSIPADSKDAEQPSLMTFPWSLYTKSPRRRMRVAFTCNVCGQRTTRAINPHAYTDGTVFVQCCGCNVFYKLVDNLKLFHEMKCYVNPSFRYNEEVSFNYLDENDDQNIFPIL